MVAQLVGIFTAMPEIQDQGPGVEVLWRKNESPLQKDSCLARQATITESQNRTGLSD